MAHAAIADEEKILILMFTYYIFKAIDGDWLL